MAGATVARAGTSILPTRLFIPSKSLRRPVQVSATLTRHHPHGGALTCSTSPHPVVSEGPSCIFVGPIETASQETLEALYRQARDAYYSGNPLIVDDMFDRVELKLRWYGSKYVVKYPRCSLRRQSTYADAQDDPSQVFALASVWFLIFAFGTSLCLVPFLYTVNEVYQNTLNSSAIYTSPLSAMQFLTVLNCVLFMLVGSAVGFPIALASAKQLHGLWRNDLVALKGECPNCGEEVFAFVRSDQSNSSPHREKCHVCECRLEFRTQAEKTLSRFGRRWVHGRVYLICDRWSRRRQMWT